VSLVAGFPWRSRFNVWCKLIAAVAVWAFCVIIMIADFEINYFGGKNEEI